MRIRTKVMAVLVLPVAILAAVTVSEVRQGLQDVQDIQDQALLAKAATGPNGLLTALQNERNRAAIELLGQADLLELPCADDASCRDQTDRSLDRFVDLVDDQDTARRAYAPAIETLGQLEELRQLVDDDPGPYDLANLDLVNPLFARYTALVDGLLVANVRLVSAIDDPELRRGAELSSMASRQTDLMARLVRSFLLAGVSSGGLDQRAELQDAGGLFGLATSNYAAIRDLARGDYAPLAERLVEEEAATGFLDRVAPQTLATGVVDLPAVFGSVSVAVDQGFYGFREDVKNVLDAAADELAADADGRSRVFLALAAVVVAVALLATFLVAWSISRPLRALTRQAADMANRRLPGALQDILDTPLGDDVRVPYVEPIQVSTRDEVADVAEALNTVQDSAVRLAVEQAVLRRNIADSFVNLGRRNQSLLGRQLDFITELEHNETDPEPLGNLFRLDHLATRMRRNAESLLVLAGIDPPRTWAAPVRINDTIRAALGEVEGYQRVAIQDVEPATILGSAAADVAHLLAELVENALLYSPPDTTVEVRGRRRHTSGTDANGYILAVVDTGLGMAPEELARANRRLAGEESFTVAPSKYLGHYVAGNLAARHGIQVVLYDTPGTGVTAIVELPPHLLTLEEAPVEAAPLPSPSPPPPPPASSWPPPSSEPRPAVPPPSSPVAAFAALADADVVVDGDATPTTGGQPEEDQRVPAADRVAASAPQPSYTESGLAKRTPRPGSDDEGALAPTGPDTELLQVLSRTADQLSAQDRTSRHLPRRIRGTQLPRTGALPRRRKRDPDDGD